MLIGQKRGIAWRAANGWQGLELLTAPAMLALTAAGCPAQLASASDRPLASASARVWGWGLALQWAPLACSGVQH